MKGGCMPVLMTMLYTFLACMAPVVFIFILGAYDKYPAFSGSVNFVVGLMQMFMQFLVSFIR
jgi:hypothetical protein